MRRGSLLFLVAATLVYGVSLLVYLISPAQWWPMGILSVGFPFTWICFLFLVPVAGYAHARTRIWLLLLWLCGLPIMLQVVAFPPAKSIHPERQPGTLRVVQWNVMQLQGVDSTTGVLLTEREAAIRFLKNIQADVLLLQDFTDYQHPRLRSNISLLRDSMGYSFMHYIPTFREYYPGTAVSGGVAIFSRIPLTQKGYIGYPGRRFADPLIWADIVWQGRPVRLVTTHFASMHLNSGKMDSDTMTPVQRQDSNVLRSGRILPKLKFYQALHVQQAALLRHFADTCPIPMVLGADLNSVPSSYVYNQARGRLSDAFLKAGSGWGGTYSSRRPVFRIDYLFISPEIQVTGWQSRRMPISDHALLVADLHLP